jgi:hypothetical protein
MSDAQSISVKPTVGEQDQLRRFVRLTHNMRDSRYMREVVRNPQSMGAGVGLDGESIVNNPTYDWDDFCSFLTMFRKVACSDDEPVYLPKILNIVMRYSPNNVREMWREPAKQINAVITHRFSAIQYSVATPEGRKKYTGSQVLDILINGRIFHEGQDKAAELSALDQVEVNCHIFMLNIDIIKPVLNRCTELRNLCTRCSFCRKLISRSRTPSSLRVCTVRWKLATGGWHE